MNKYWIINDKNIMSYINKRILNEYIIIEGIGDICLEKHPKFINAREVYIMNCDKNYVYYHVDNSIFPKLKNLFLCSHPCEPIFFTRFNKENQRILLIDYYKNYKNRWCLRNDNVIVIDENSYNRSLNIIKDEYKNELIIR